ncbi:MAG: beta-glucuronidase [Solirubrobacteraceae bacterium]
MLRPKDTVTRERRSLDGLWRFAIDTEGVGRSEGWWEGPLAGTREMPVPASYNDIPADATVRDHVGDAWYQTVVRVPAGWGGRRMVLRFDAATHCAVVWLDATRVAEHEGGYTPFEADVTELVEPGAEHRVTVVVSNVLSWQSIPPGFVEDTPDGPRQRYFHDFFNYAGLHRSVWLSTTPKSYVEDVTVVTGLDGSLGTIGYVVEAEGGDDLEVRVALRDAGGAEVARATGAAGALTVADVHPWRPGEGYLYDLDVELWGDGVAPVDAYTLPVGVRTVKVEGTRFLINGEPFHFKGFGRHEDSAVRGKGHDNPFMVHDFALMQWLGANSFRTSHYPYAEEVLDYADRHGVVVIDETAAVGMNMGLAAGIFGGPSLPTFSAETVNDATQAVHRQAIRELVARDKNHPSVVLWSVANEPESNTPAARAYFEPLAAEARRLDASRPVGFVNMMLAPPDRDVVTDLFDVVMLNRYYGWYEFPGDLAAAERELEAELDAWAAKHGKPILVTEYGADAVAGMHGAPATPWTEEYQAELLEMSHRVFDRVDAVVGEHVWNFADFAVGPGVFRADGNKKGIFTRERRPKSSAQVLRRRWRPLP